LEFEDVDRIAAGLYLDVSAEHAEGVVWDARRQRLLFVDITTGRVFEHDPASGTTSVVRVGRHVGAVHPRRSDGVVIAVREGFALLTDSRVVTVSAPLADEPAVRMNDGGCDPAGRYFAGSMAYDTTPGAGCLFRLDPDLSLHTVLTGVTISNGIDWSPGGELCYYVDSGEHRVDVFDFDVPTGELSNRRPFVEIAESLGVPDGLTVDRGGGVWVALFGGSEVRRFSPAGRLDCVVEVAGPTLVTSCCFGGADLDQLFISTSTENLTAEQLLDQPGAGCIFLANPGWSGKPAVPFGG
jgi:sugar lactone lactonase YvrE